MTDQPPPKVLPWFRVYSAALCLMYLFSIALGVCFAFFPTITSRITDEEDLVINGWVLLLGGMLLFVGSALPFFFKPRPWVWIYDLVIICSGMLSCCLIFASIPLLIFWIKPETRRYFGRSDA